MKIKVLTHKKEDYVAQKKGETQKIIRNPDPVLHPFERAREMKRALNAVKMDKIFAKPLLAALEAHRDAVKCMARAHTYLTQMYSGSCDGEIKYFDLGAKQCFRAIRAHEGFVRGLTTTHDDRFLYSCGDDGLIKQWRLEANGRIDRLEVEDMEDIGNLAYNGRTETMGSEFPPVATFRTGGRLTSLDHSWQKPQLVATSDIVAVWDTNRGAQVQSFEWGCDTLLCARFNPSQPEVVVVSGNDNTIALYDAREGSAMRKVILKNRTNDLAWNPQEPLAFAAANEDSNIYTFDMRKLNAAMHVHKGFVNAALTVDFSPDGLELVGGSYDKTVRIWEKDAMLSRDVYHTKRMGKVLSVRFSADARFVVSGSEEGNLRIWKRVAAESLGPRTAREEAAIEYRNALKERYAHLPEVRRIARHHHVPKLVKRLGEKHKVMGDAKKARLANSIQHGSTPASALVPEKKKAIRGELE